MPHRSSALIMRMYGLTLCITSFTRILSKVPFGNGRPGTPKHLSLSTTILALKGFILETTQVLSGLGFFRSIFRSGRRCFWKWANAE